jgi:signal transduction histidine kinase
MIGSRLPRAAGLSALCIALLAALGWALGESALTSFVPGWPTLKANTALAMGALGGALLASGRLRQGLAAAAGLVALSSLVEWTGGVDLGIDELLISDPASRTAGAPPGRMAAATAAGLLLVAIAALVPRPVPSQLCALAAFGTGWLALLAHAAELGPLTGVWSFGTVSLPTALALCALGAGAAALHPSEGLAPALTADHGGARLLRMLGPGAVLLPALTAFGMARVGRWLDWPGGFSLAAATTLDVVLFSGMLAVTAAATARAEQSRQEALDEAARMRIEANEDERRAVASELHDALGQSLTALGWVLARVPPHEGVSEARELVGALREDVRRIALDLRPSLLDDLGLAPALRWQVGVWSARSGVAATFEASGAGGRHAQAVENAAFRIFQEALTNVRLEQRPDGVCLEVIDDGVGFVPSLPRPPSLGLSGMAERARLAGGSLTVNSSPGSSSPGSSSPGSSSGGGTSISVWLPA